MIRPSSFDRGVVFVYDNSGWGNVMIPRSYEGVQYAPVREVDTVVGKYVLRVRV